MTSIGEYAFYNCSGLTSVNIPNSVTSINYGIFKNCTNLESVNIPENVDTIDNMAFQNCKKLSQIELPDGLIYIGHDVFIGCAKLTSIYIPNSVKALGGYYGSDFEGCTRLKKIYCNISDPNSINQYTFRDIATTIYVPIGTKEAYEDYGFVTYSTFEEMDMTGVEEMKNTQNTKPIEYYNLKGQRINKPKRGIVIEKYNDSTSRKVMLK